MKASQTLVLVAVLLGACSPTTTDAEFPNGTVHEQATFVTFDSIEAMSEASDLVVVGTVVDVTDGFFEEAPETEDFKGTQFLSVVIRIDEVLQGASESKTVEVRWFGYDVSEDGEKGPQAIINGEYPPRVGDQDVWFLKTGLPGGYTARLAGEGRLSIVDDQKLEPTNNLSSGAAKEIEELDLDGLRSVFDG